MRHRPQKQDLLDRARPEGTALNDSQRQTRREQQAAILANQVALVYNALPLSIVAVTTGAIFVSVFLWGSIAPTTLVAWLVASALVSVYRLHILRRYRQTAPSADEIEPWRHAVTIGAYLSGLVWGSAALFLYPPEATEQAFLAMVVAGMAAGSITTLAPLRAAALGFLLLSLSPLMLRSALESSALGHSLAILGCLYFFTLSISAKRLYLAIEETFRLRHERKQTEERIERQAMYDSLTDLPNRRLLLSRLDQEISRANREHQVGAALFLDLDRFKHINDSLGHHVGDQLLQEVARRLRESLRIEDMAARLGGDEFVVMPGEFGEDSEHALQLAQHVGERIREALGQPYLIGSFNLRVTASIGIALFPRDGQSGAEILKHADTAMYRAKESGRDTVQFYQPTMQVAAQRLLELEKGLRTALEEDQLELHFQPQLDVTGSIIGAEALVRWRHPENGMVPPGEFIPVAEETGLITPIGNWVLNDTCQKLRWLQDDPRIAHPISISVNLSAHQFLHREFVNQTRHIIERSKVDPTRLEFEVTETLMMKDFRDAIGKMESLKALGIRFSVDDFGTGYSSLAYLKRFPLDGLKIDRSFVRDITTDPSDAAIVDAILAMSARLGLTVVAEGVESAQAAAFLEEKGCDIFQGYYYARPMPWDAFVEYLLATKRAQAEFSRSAANH